MLPESTREKSVMLAKAMGLTVYWRQGIFNSVIQVFRTDGFLFWDGWDDGSTPEFDLYDPANMALCLRCLNWARRRLPPQQKQQLKDWLIYRIRNDLIFFLDTQDDQEYILDYVLELMIEAGLVEVS
jgi:hypothetical protein